MIKRCSCKHLGQDKIHGKGRRVHNEAKGNGNTTIFRCTVCLKET